MNRYKIDIHLYKNYKDPKHALSHLCLALLDLGSEMSSLIYMYICIYIHIHIHVYICIFIINTYKYTSIDMLAGGFPRVLFPPLWCFPPGCLGAMPPPVFRRSMIMSPHAEPTSGCSAPDSGWQSAAARPGTTLSVPAPGRPPGHRQDIQ